MDRQTCYSRYNRMLSRGEPVASTEMPKWIMRLMPDVWLGAEMSIWARR
jgi:hypothetical protein